MIWGTNLVEISFPRCALFFAYKKKYSMKKYNQILFLIFTFKLNEINTF